MISVVHCISDTNFGGAGRVLLNYLNHFDRNKYKASVVLPKGSKLLEYMNSEEYDIIEFDGLYDRSYNFGDVRRLITLFKRIKPDIVHSHGALSTRIAGKICGCKVVFTRHSIFDLPRWQTSFVGKFVLGSFNSMLSNRIIAVSPAAKTLLIETGTPADKIDVVFNGVEPVIKNSPEDILQCKEHYKILKEEFVCSIIARLETVKGHKYVIDAAKLLKENCTDIKILIAGAGGIQQELISYAESQGVTDVVSFVGFIKEIDKLLSITDLQLNASFGTEATSMSLLEGFSMGIPAVVSDFGGNPFVVDNNKNGFVVPKKSPKELCDAILSLKNDRELLKKFSDHAKETYKAKFTAEKMTKDMEDVYIKILKESTKQ